jgi:CoA:oxalate CoA-transferase
MPLYRASARPALIRNGPPSISSRSPWAASTGTTRTPFLLPDNYWGDLMSGAYAAIAVLLSLFGRMRTGRGQHIDISMQDVMYYNNYRAMMDRALGPIIGNVEKDLGRKPEAVLNSEDRMPFYGFFRSKDGKVAIVSLTPRQWKDLAGIIGRPEMAGDPRFSNLIAQIQNHKEAVALIEEWTSLHTSSEIISMLESKKIPCGIAYTSRQVNCDENLKERGMFRTVRHSLYGEIDVPGFPFKFSEYEGSLRMPAPGLGEHSRAILEERLGYSSAEVDALYRDRVIL